MYQPIQLTNSISAIRNSISSSPLRRGFLLIPFALALAWFALSATAQAQLPSPTPDGGYPGSNTAEGDGALNNLTSGTDNTATGGFALYSNTNGTDNTANGSLALGSNTTGGANTATGSHALFSNTTASYNTATGFVALINNTTGNFNTANGAQALFLNTTGTANTANGYLALDSNTTGNNNTATGASALGGENTTANFNTGNDNTATGYEALFSNTTGGNNTANGSGALLSNTTGGNNTAYGFEALEHNTTGSSNIALGTQAGTNLTTGSNNIDIGNRGVKGESNKIRIGKVGTQSGTFIAGISGITVAGGVGVIIDTNGHLGTIQSSERFKESIKPMDKASEAILALQPVTFHYKHDLDPDGIPQFGLIAEQVEKVNPELVARDTDGKINTVRYEAVNAMLLNEFLKEHRTVQDLKKEVAALTATVKEQASQIKKVSDELEVSRPVPQIVADNQ
jgi:Chaperone of endosialidase